MKAGTLIKLPDGREGTVVYNGLDGCGIVWGRRAIDVDKILQCNPREDDCPAPEAMLRKPELERFIGLPCVGDVYEVIE